MTIFGYNYEHIWNSNDRVQSQNVMIQHDLIQNVLIQNVLIQNALIQKCPDSKCPGLVARHGEELWIYEYKYTKKDTSPGHFESGHFEIKTFWIRTFWIRTCWIRTFESGHVESWRLVTVPYHYCSIYVRSYTRRWSRMSSFKQKNQNTKTWSGAINLWIQIHKKRIQVPDILNQDIFGSCHVESWRFVAILFNIW